LPADRLSRHPWPPSAPSWGSRCRCSPPPSGSCARISAPTRDVRGTPRAASSWTTTSPSWLPRSI